MWPKAIIVDSVDFTSLHPLLQVKSLLGSDDGHRLSIDVNSFTF